MAEEGFLAFSTEELRTACVDNSLDDTGNDDVLIERLLGVWSEVLDEEPADWSETWIGRETPSESIVFKQESEVLTIIDKDDNESTPDDLHDGRLMLHKMFVEEKEAGRFYDKEV